MTNAEIAAELVRQAGQLMTERAAHLCAAAVIRDTKTFPAAIRALREWHGPADVVSRAVEIINQYEGR